MTPLRVHQTHYYKNIHADWLKELSLMRLVPLTLPSDWSVFDFPFSLLVGSGERSGQSRKRCELAVRQVNIQQRMLAVLMSDTTNGQQLPNNRSKDETTCFVEDIKVLYEKRVTLFVTVWEWRSYRARPAVISLPASPSANDMMCSSLIITASNTGQHVIRDNKTNRTGSAASCSDVKNDIKIQNTSDNNSTWLFGELRIMLRPQSWD